MRPIHQLLVCLCLIAHPIDIGSPLVAQTRLQVKEVNGLPTASEWLAGKPEAIRGRHFEMESVIDLAQPSLRDSIIEVKRQRNVALLGWTMKNVLALYWERLDPRKQKYVGSSSRRMEVFDGIAKEVDINLFIMPHLPRYIGFVRNAYQRAIAHNRGNTNQFRFDNPPYPSPEELRFDEKGYFTIECELTPPEACREEFQERFMPMEMGANNLATHPNFGEEYPSFGMMGPLCLDCNHNCRPEIHPFEWLWWLDMQPENGDPGDWQWMLGLLHDGTGRYEDWSGSPLEGQLAVPFRIAAGSWRYRLQIEPLLVSRPLEVATVLPAGAMSMSAGTKDFQLGENGPVLSVEVKALAGFEKVYWWVDDLRLDKQSGDVFGYLKIAANVREAMAARVSAGPR